MSQYLHAVEFLGGPFDGHKLVVPVAADEELADTVNFPVNRNAFRVLEKECQIAASPVTSVAVYALERSPGQFRYHFLGAVAPESLPADDR